MVDEEITKLKNVLDRKQRKQRQIDIIDIQEKIFNIKYKFKKSNPTDEEKFNMKYKLPELQLQLQYKLVEYNELYKEIIIKEFKELKEI